MGTVMVESNLRQYFPVGTNWGQSENGIAMTSLFPRSLYSPSPQNFLTMGQLTVYSDFYFPHIRCGHVIQGAAFILPRLVTFDVRDFQVFILTHKALAFWEERKR